MEEQQRMEIEQGFPKANNTIIVLNIPDVYNYMEPDLVRLLKEKTKQFFSYLTLYSINETCQ